MYALQDVLLSLSSVVTSTSALVVAAIIIAITLISHITAPKYTPLEPPPLPHLLPFFGHAFSFVRDQRAFFEQANKKMHAKPFSIFLAGTKLYIFHSPAAVSLIFRTRPTALTTTQSDHRAFRINIAGFRPADADVLAALHGPERALHTTHLLSASALHFTTTRLMEELDSLLYMLESDLAVRAAACGARRGSVERVGFNFIGDVLMRATLGALFGRAAFAPAAYPYLFEDFRLFLSERFFERVVGFPGFVVARGAVGARERIKRRVRGVVREVVEGRGADVSEYVRERIVKLGELGLSFEGVVSNEFDIIVVGSNLNSIPITYLSLLHILASPSLLSSTLAELHATHFLTLPPAERAILIPTALPVLHALVREVLRYHSTAWSAREVSETTILGLKYPGEVASRSYELVKGGIVACPASLLHHDATIHSNPETFNPKRFLSNELGGLGTPVSNWTLRPFGGGSSYCPGRLFAERQVVGCLAVVLGRFDLEVLGIAGREMADNKKGWDVPRNADFFFVAKCVDVIVRVSKREGNWEN